MIVEMLEVIWVGRKSVALKIHFKYRLSTILKTIRKVYQVMFFDIQKCVYSESLFNMLHIKIKSKYKKNLLRTK